MTSYLILSEFLKERRRTIFGNVFRLDREASKELVLDPLQCCGIFVVDVVVLRIVYACPRHIPRVPIRKSLFERHDALRCYALIGVFYDLQLGLAARQYLLGFCKSHSLNKIDGFPGQAYLACDCICGNVLVSTIFCDVLVFHPLPIREALRLEKRGECVKVEFDYVAHVVEETCDDRTLCIFHTRVVFAQYPRDTRSAELMQLQRGRDPVAIVCFLHGHTVQYSRWMLVGKISLPVVVALMIFVPLTSHAQATLTPDTMTIEKAQVTAVSNEQTAAIPGTDTQAQKQTITAHVLDGMDVGKSVSFENDYIQLTEGDVFYLRHITNSVDDTDYYSVADPYRLNVLAALAAVFLILLFIFGGLPGIRGLSALVGSIVLIFFLLLPGILHGYSPILVSIGVSSLIIIVGSYITHGFNRTTSAAVIGMIATVIITGIGAYIAVHAAHLSGYTSDENVYLAFDSRGTIDMVGLLFGGIMIGLLGVLYDIAIGQAIAVEELFATGEHMDRGRVYKRPIRIGREHIGALVNTLAIAYVGAALPLLLLIQSATFGPFFIINNELFATEIVRILIGSIGLVLAVPITTAIATYMLSSKEKGV